MIGAETIVAGAGGAPAHGFAQDATLVRALAGADFRRADTVRDERAADDGHAVERWLRALPGWLPPRRLRRRTIDALAAAVADVVQGLRALSDAAVAERLRAELPALKAAGRAAPESPALAAALACVAEASRRRLGLWPHPVQLASACVLMRGGLAEMRTGEGKTLVAALAATLMAAAGTRVHIVSTNDYLARRDCEEMSPLYAFFGLAGGHVQGDMDADQRRAAYACAVCHVPGKDLVFDYLKDSLAGHGRVPTRVASLAPLLAAGAAAPAAPPLIPALHFAIVDEADSVLIDEARTPMILSRDAPGVHEPALLHWAVAAARGLVEGRHFRIGSDRQLDLLPGADDACAPLPPGVRAVWRARAWRGLLLRQALTALHLFHRDQHYILADGKVQIVDESTGRVMPDRSWEQGLHQLIEAKEGVELTSGRETLARMTYQRFFRRYTLLAGLTGTAAEAARELYAVYRLRVVRVPTHRPVRRRAWPALCLADGAARWRAVAAEAMAAAGRGQPVLVGTRSVEASEQLSAEFERRGQAVVVLNARQDALEAEVVAGAGQSGRITVATNMAGRGTDIKLDARARACGGLHVVLTEYHESPRVDRQLFGRCARQGDAGSVRAIVAAADGLFRPVPRPLLRLLGAIGGPPQRLLLRALVHWAQALAERRALEMRLATLRQDRELHRLIGFAGASN